MISTATVARPEPIQRLRRLLADNPVVAILGARQVGKSTLAALVAAHHRGPVTRFDCERAADLARLRDPELALGSLSGLVVVDEIQRRPDLFPSLRVLVDRPRNRARFLVLGSASQELLRQGAETLAGRIAFLHLDGFCLSEVGSRSLDRLWLRGGFPRSFLARSEAGSSQWRRDFVATFLERDLAQMGIGLPSATLGRFWSMLAHRHGRVWNGSEMGQSFGVSHTTVRRYLDALTGTFMVRQLLPWHENLTKRQVKAPKVYLADSGLLHTLLDIQTSHDLKGHPVLGASFEGFALSEVTHRMRARPDQCYFWATHSGAELDLLVVQGRRRIGFEFKYSSAPEVTRSMRVALADLRLDRLYVIHAGEHSFPMAERIQALALSSILEELEPLA